MIAYLKGKILEKTAEGIILDVNGVGYELAMPTGALSKLLAKGEEASLYTYLHVREDVMQLFGFLSAADKEMFEKLLSVTKIGPKVAISLLSAFSVTALKKAILLEDVDLLAAIPGIGKKTAQRLVLELKEKLALPDLEVVSSGKGAEKDFQAVYTQTRDALLGLRYSPLEAKNALEGYSPDGEPDVEQMLKYALKNLAAG
jgi:Holliday junction DNA helicase RuvA